MNRENTRSLYFAAFVICVTLLTAYALELTRPKVAKQPSPAAIENVPPPPHNLPAAAARGVQHFLATVAQ